MLEKAVTKSKEETERQIKEMLEKNRDDVLEVFKKLQSQQRSIYKTFTDDWKYDKEAGGENIVQYDGSLESMYVRNGHFHTKAITVVQDVPGAVVESGRLWTPLTGGNPFRQDIFIQPVTGGSFQVISLGEFGFQQRANSKAALAGGAGSSAIQIPVESFELLDTLSLAADDDVPAYYAAIESAIMYADTKIKGIEVFNVLKASVADNAGFAQVKTGKAAALPDDDKILGVMADLSTAIGTDYMDNAVFHVSRPLYAKLLKGSSGSGGEWIWNPATANYSLFGYPVRVNDRMEAGNGAGQVSAMFGNFFLGCTLGERVDLEIGANPYTNPGNLTFYARSRFKPVVNDTNAVAGLISKA